MFVGIDMPTAVDIAGGADHWNTDQHDRFTSHFKLKLRSVVVTRGYGEQCLGALMRSYPTLFACWSSCINPSYAHETLLHDQHNLDPWHSLDPTYPWHLYVSRVKIYEKCE
jgi:hypothetical protein